MTDETTTKKLELRPVEVAAGAGAAVMTAFATSFLGTAGTLTGAALASVVGTVSTSVLRTSADRSTESLRRTTARLRQTRLGPELDELGGGSHAAGIEPADTAREIDPYGAHLFGAERDRTGTAGDPDPTAAANTDPDGTARPGTPGDTVPGDTRPAATGPGPTGTGPRGTGPSGTDPGPPDGRSRRPRWVILAAGAVVAFAAALAVITGIESAAGKPLAAIVGAKTGSGTTLGAVTGSDAGSSSDRKERQTPSPSSTPSGTATTSTESSASVGSSPAAGTSTTVPIPSPSSTNSVPSVPDPTPTQAPTASPNP